MTLTAIVIAIGSVTLMSFKSFNTSKSIEEPALFWYDIDENGNIGTLQNQNPSVQQTKSESKFGGTKQITLCDDTQSQACLQGYATPQMPGNPAGTPTSSEHVINRN